MIRGMSGEAPRILIVLFGAIGDVTRAVPLLARLREACPGAHLAWAVEPAAAPVLDGHPALDERLLFERRHGIAGYARLLRALRRGRFDVVLDLGRLLKTGIAAWATRAPRRIGFHRRNSREGNWALQTEAIPPQAHYSSKLVQFQCFADHLGLPPAPVRFDLTLSEGEQARAGALLADLPRPVVAFGLGSSCPSRRWFPDRTAAVARAAWEEHGASMVLLGTAADRPFADAIRGHAAGPVRDLVGITTLRELMAVLARSSLVVTPDSGTMHLGAALGVPVVSMWGATSAARSAPYGSRALTIEGSAPCAPCYLTKCRIGRMCMQTIEVDAVIARVDSVLSEARHTRVPGA